MSDETTGSADDALPRTAEDWATATRKAFSPGRQKGPTCLCSASDMATCSDQECANAGKRAVVEDDDDEFEFCECCDGKARIEEMTGCGDGCWMCPKCAAEAAEAFRTCDHKWSPAHDEFGDPGQYCERCSHIVLNEDFAALFGTAPPPEPAS